MDETNINAAMCIKEKSHFGYDEMINFCTGRTYRVDWVASDWIAIAFLVTVLVALALLVIWMIQEMRDLY